MHFVHFKAALNPSICQVYVSYPVQRVSVECVAVLFPVHLTLRLKTDLADVEDIALLLLLTMADLFTDKALIIKP